MTIRRFYPIDLLAYENMDNAALVETLNNAAPADAADFLVGMDDIGLIRALSLLDLERQAVIFGYFPLERQLELWPSMTCPAAAALFSALPPDEQADLYNRLDPERQGRLLKSLSSTDSATLLKLAAYPAGTVGTVTTSDFISVNENMSVARAMEEIKSKARGTETIYVIYVLDRDCRLIGTVSLRELVLAEPETKVYALMRRSPVFIRAGAPRGEAADLVQRYDLLALPVLDENEMMLGVVTVDEAMDIAEEEDVSELAAFGGSTSKAAELDLRQSSLCRMFTARFFWLAVLTFFGVATSNLVAGQEELLSEVIILAAFLAPIIDMGGNTGSQSATLVIRAMALGQVRLRLKDFIFVLRRDLPVALALGISVALLEVVLAYLSKGVDLKIMLTVGCSMLAVTVAGSLIGLLLPFAARRIGTDPATISSPMITSIMDLLGVLIYFAFAYFFLGDLLQ